MSSIKVIDCILDTTDMTMQTELGSKMVVNYDQIERLEYKQVAAKKWLVMNTKADAVLIFIKGKDQSFIIRSDSFNAPFESTVKHLRKFAEKNHIVIIS